MRQRFLPSLLVVVLTSSAPALVGLASLRAQSRVGRLPDLRARGVSGRSSVARPGITRSAVDATPRSASLAEIRRQVREAALAGGAADARAAAGTPLWSSYYYGFPGAGFSWPGTTYKGYGPPVALEPALGLQHIYRHGWQMGIQVPEDASPLETYSLGPFRGVVRSPQYPSWLHERSDGPGVAADPTTSAALELLREGAYRDAGRILAEAYREAKDPTQGVLLVEALAALGKTRYAELLFRSVLEREGALESLPADVRGHFGSSPEDAKAAFEKVRSALAGTDDAPLVSAYFQLFGETPETGLDALLELANERDDALARALYEHYLVRAFGDEEPDAGESSDAGVRVERGGESL